MRINCETFDFIFERIANLIHKEPTYRVLNPIEDHPQLGLTIYRIAHGYSFKVIISSNTWYSPYKMIFFCLPRTKAGCTNECKGFIENYEFPCVGAFHVHVACHLKNYFSFKNKCTITSRGVSAQNKRFLYLTTGAPGSRQDGRLLRYSTLFKSIKSGGGLPNKTIILGDF